MARPRGTRHNSTALKTTYYYWAFAILSAIALLAPIRAGDLPGYDDARYAHVAKGIVTSGDWLRPRSNGYPDLEHPPLFEWMQAICFTVFGVSDPMAKCPSALCGLGTVLLLGWLGRRLTSDPLLGLVAMFAMATSAYFLKYASHAMTDVPATFFFLASVCAWVIAREDERWTPAAGLFAAFTLMTRGFVGFALPLIFIADLLINRRKPGWRFAAPSLILAIAPLAIWYAWLIHLYGHWFFVVHAAWLDREVYAPMNPAWRKYTGLFEYAFMLVKSYWPWLPCSIAGCMAVVRRRERADYLLLVWVSVVAVLCAAASSRVLRYMLPAYPALAILAATGICRFIPLKYVTGGLRIAAPVMGLVALAFAVFPPNARHATEIRPIADAATAATRPGQRVAFYDAGDPRFDETNQMQWYGSRNLFILENPSMLQKMLSAPQTNVLVLDKASYRECCEFKIPNRIIKESGHLVCFRLTR